MKAQRFATIEEINTALLEDLKTIPKSAYEKWFEDWKKRWHKCIISEGDYFEGNHVDNINLRENILTLTRIRTWVIRILVQKRIFSLKLLT